MEIIDFHTHPYLEDDQYINGYSPLGIVGKRKIADKIRRDMERAGIGHICGSVIEKGNRMWPGSFTYLRRLNNAALELREIMGDFYTPGFHIHPWFIQESVKEIEYMAGEGVGLIGELVPYAYGAYSYSSQGLNEILYAAGAHKMAVSYHSTDDDNADSMLVQHPDVTFVAAHPGEKKRLDRHLDRMIRYQNVCLDLSGTGLSRLGALSYGISKVGAERFLFGTDYPVNNPAMYVQGILYEGLSEADMESVFYKNAARLVAL